MILVDEQADIEHIRRRFYRSHLLWQQRVFIEPRRFVHQCIIRNKYEHIRPLRKGMPGAPPGSMGGRVYVISYSFLSRLLIYSSDASHSQRKTMIISPTTSRLLFLMLLMEDGWGIPCTRH